MADAAAAMVALVLLASVYALVRLLLDTIVVRVRSDAEREMELLALRHEVAVLSRQVKRPELLPIDRLILAAVGRRLPGGRLLFSPATLLRWHRELVRRRWAAFGRRPRRGRPRIPDDLRELILRIGRENSRWGERRIQGELLKLGLRVSNSTIRKVLRRHRLGPATRRTGMGWSEFLRGQAGAVLACDFLTVDTVRLRTLYALVVLELRTRRVVFANATAHPDRSWMAQQARNLAWNLDDLGTTAEILIHDRDSKFTAEFDRLLRQHGPLVKLTPFRSPRSNAHCERLVRTVRRECLDWVLVHGERHLGRILREYFEHYNHARPHRALQLLPPALEDLPRAGPIERRQRLNGLINEYSRAA